MIVFSLLRVGTRSALRSAVVYARRPLATLPPRNNDESSVKQPDSETARRDPWPHMRALFQSDGEGESTSPVTETSSSTRRPIFAERFPDGCFKRRPEAKECMQIELFHKPGSADSEQVLDMLNKARTEPFPRPSKASQVLKPIKRRRRGEPTHYGPAPIPPPLKFGLDVREDVPTAEQFIEMRSMLNTPTSLASLFLSQSLPFSEHPTSAAQLEQLVKDKPDLLRWPIAVCKAEQIVTVGLDTKALLRAMKKHADKRNIPKRGPPVYDPEVDKARDSEMRKRRLEKGERKGSWQGRLAHGSEPGSTGKGPFDAAAYTPVRDELHEKIARLRAEELKGRRFGLARADADANTDGEARAVRRRRDDKPISADPVLERGDRRPSHTSRDSGRRYAQESRASFGLAKR